MVAHSETGEQFMAVGRTLRRRFSAALAGYGLTPAQARALRALATDDAPRLSTLADRLGIAPRSATEVVDALEERGWVRRRADPEDRRATCVELTPSGSSLLIQIAEVRRTESTAFFAALSPTDRKHLNRILGRLAADGDQG